jgi:cell division protein FtsW (lipid II flippase)
MRLIEKGLTPEEFRAYFKDADKKPRSPYSTLKWGMLFMFLGLAVFLGVILEYTMEAGEDLMPAFLLFFGGAAFIVYYLIVRSKFNGSTSGPSAADITKT